MLLANHLCCSSILNGSVAIATNHNKLTNVTGIREILHEGVAERLIQHSEYSIYSVLEHVLATVTIKFQACCVTACMVHACTGNDSWFVRLQLSKLGHSLASSTF